MQMGSPSAALVTVRPSSGGVFRGNDTTSEADEVYALFGSEPALASNYSHVGVWNPAGSGVTLLLDYIGANALAVTIVQLRYLTSILATDDGVWSPLNGTGANGLCHGCSEQNVALQGTLMTTLWTGADVGYRLGLTFPLVVLPNSGMAVVSSVVARECRGDFIGREI